MKASCNNYNKQGHQTHECQAKVINAPSTQRFNGYCFNYQKFGHKAYECRSKAKWTPNKLSNAPKQGNIYNWDYNTRYSYHYCQEYGHIPKNCTRTHFRGNYKRWLNEIVFFSCHKLGHVKRNCPTKAPTPSNANNKGKDQVDAEQVKRKMNAIWRKKEECSANNESEVTSSSGSSDHTTSI
jgi:hypothetical protein